MLIRSPFLAKYDVIGHHRTHFSMEKLRARRHNSLFHLVLPPFYVMQKLEIF